MEADLWVPFADFPPGLGLVLVKASLGAYLALSMHTQAQQRQPETVDHFLASNKWSKANYRQCLTLVCNRLIAD